MKKPLLKDPIVKDPVNCPLADYEKENQLSQKERSPCAPWYQTSVIKMNSSFLECTDVLSAHRGFVTTFMLPLLLMPLSAMLFGIGITVERWSTYSAEEQQSELVFTITELIVTSLLSWAILWVMCRECFRYTHYPMRFNRKTRKVYVFRHDGTAMIEDWNKLYFTHIKAGPGDRKVVFFRLAEDRDTVLERFVLPFVADENEHFLFAQWEFVRRYMEEPDALPHLAGQVEHVQDVADRRETWLHGFKRLMLEYAGGFPLLMVIMSPIVFLLSIGRWISVQTCTVPIWSEEVEKECQIEPNDPYIRDRDHLSKPGTVPKPEGAQW